MPWIIGSIWYHLKIFPEELQQHFNYLKYLQKTSGLDVSQNRSKGLQTCSWSAIRQKSVIHRRQRHTNLSTYSSCRALYSEPEVSAWVEKTYCQSSFQLHTVCKPKIDATSLMLQGSCPKAFWQKSYLHTNSKIIINNSWLIHDVLQSQRVAGWIFLLSLGDE